MPQKRNPDLLELVRAKAAFVDGQAATIRAITGHLPSGYHRDLQQTKGPFLIALEEAAGCVTVMHLAMSRLAVDERRLRDGCTPELMATDRAYELVAHGMAFRDAYRQVGAELREAGDGAPPRDDAALAAALAKDYPGAPGNLALENARGELQKLRDAVDDDRSAVTGALVRLAGPTAERLTEAARSWDG
jgi:argininosuccinate lyase